MVAVVMYRHADKKEHGYLLGVWHFLESAEKMAWKEYVNRGHKYVPEFNIIDDGYVKERWFGEIETRFKKPEKSNESSSSE